MPPNLGSPRRRGMRRKRVVVLLALLITVGVFLSFRTPTLPTNQPRAAGDSPHSLIHKPPLIGHPPLNASQIQEGVHKHLPLNRFQCGTWPQKYAKLHKDILAGRAPQRYTVMRSRAEFGNGLVSMCLLACISDSPSLLIAPVPAGRPACHLGDHLPVCAAHRPGLPL